MGLYLPETGVKSQEINSSYGEKRLKSLTEKQVASGGKKQLSRKLILFGDYIYLKIGVKTPKSITY